MWDAGAVNTTTAANARIDEAVALARRSDAAIIVAGLEEGEFRDRAFLNLPGRQDTLITAVWYPGEQGGRAVADAIFGDDNPAGRLPITFAMSEGQLPLSYNHKPTGRGDDYLDLTGMALFPFGFGLSYTSFAYSNLRIEPAIIGARDVATVRCTVTNAGGRVGDEVVQLYVRDVLASLARPVIELKGFRRVRLAPGESREIGFSLGPDHLRMLNDKLEWIVEPGDFRVLIGASSRDIKLRGSLTVR
jgi:beta-glucosidase